MSVDEFIQKYNSILAKFRAHVVSEESGLSDAVLTLDEWAEELDIYLSAIMGE